MAQYSKHHFLIYVVARLVIEHSLLEETPQAFAAFTDRNLDNHQFACIICQLMFFFLIASSSTATLELPNKFAQTNCPCYKRSKETVHHPIIDQIRAFAT